MSTLPEPPHEGTLPYSGQPGWVAEIDAPVPTQFGDFEIVSKLGQGAFGQVYLARQASLNRHVALKVIRGKFSEPSDRGEGELLAGLEHDHIVKVYSAFADDATRTYGLCLQYVPGADLGVVIRQMFANGAAPETGQAFLEALDKVRRGDPGFDPAALRDREALAGDNYAQAVCRIGRRLAEALAFAHARGILHCDIKPGNILLTPYGRPMLADFNVAFDRSRHKGDGTRFGGTLAYMAPEYRAAMLGQTHGCADERCDIYSLGVVLHELATGMRPQPRQVRESASTALPVSPGNQASDPRDTSDATNPLARVPRELAAVIRRCIDHDAARRYQSAAELAAALAGAWQLLAARRALPVPGRLGRFVIARPALALAIAAVLPHLAASAAQIGYNAVEVQLDAVQQQAFAILVVVYNLLAYPLCFGLAVWLIWRVARPLPRLRELPGPEMDRLRRNARRLAGQLAGLGALGWFPGGLIFPLVIHLTAGSLTWQTYAHFVVSFTLAGLIAVVFSYLGVQYVVFRAILPRLGNPDAHTPGAMWAEIRPLTIPFGPLVVVANGVPLVGAVLLLTLDSGVMTFGFRLLIVGLIGLGAAGVLLAERVVRALRQLAAVWEMEAGKGV